jgi:hypothetical protein
MARVYAVDPGTLGRSDLRRIVDVRAEAIAKARSWGASRINRPDVVRLGYGLFPSENVGPGARLLGKPTDLLTPRSRRAGRPLPSRHGPARRRGPRVRTVQRPSGTPGRTPRLQLGCALCLRARIEEGLMCRAKPWVLPFCLVNRVVWTKRRMRWTRSASGRHAGSSANAGLTTEVARHVGTVTPWTALPSDLAAGSHSSTSGDHTVLSSRSHSNFCSPVLIGRNAARSPN